ncbi:MAG: transporter substrate-binding domain-containing protein [Gracilimonas sp.]|uniref:transglycosylase SLT domain-containing protein n=1 Tax=Gracilimonas sp. TaxID=1974203 RepID=UPI0019AA4DA9|nr:transporter substrate-binding domain-containing protein [Gracilimonas sp.]MBD3616204.1 transporter substrate-binding domain-containing protein [Gracilimonas sp.]
MNNKRNNMQSFRSIGALLLVMSCVLLSGCINEDDIDRFIEEYFGQSTQTVERDFEQIKESGVLRMITGYGADKYFLRHGYESGFEYELLNEFAKEYGLELEVIFLGVDEHPHNLLNSGTGDVIANNYTVSSQKRRTVNFSRPYKLSDKIIVYSDSLEIQPETLEDFSVKRIPVYVRRNSTDHTHLERLEEQGYDLNINFVPYNEDAKSLLMQVSGGEIKAAVLDEQTYQAGSGYFPGLQAGPVIAQKDTIAWAIRKNAPGLEAKLNSFLEKHFRFSDVREEPLRSAFLNQLRYRYHNQSPYVEDYYNPEKYYSSMGLISSFEDLTKSVADSVGLDWLLLTSMVIQESGFNPEAKSFAGAVGLMQILPRFSVTEYNNLYDPLTNLHEGAWILKNNLNHYAYLDSVNQLSFALATYNAGNGHMIDARRLAMEHNRDPNEWENVEDALLKLMQERYHQYARHGYIRGIETVQYVKEIRNRYQMYNRVAALNGEKISNLH